MQLTFIITAIGLGIAYSAAPGAVNTEAIRRGAAHHQSGPGCPCVLTREGTPIGGTVGVPLFGGWDGSSPLWLFLPDQPRAPCYPGQNSTRFDAGPLRQALVGSIVVQADRLFVSIKATDRTTPIRRMHHNGSSFEAK